MVSMENNRAVWGVIGGMGPLASAEFLKTVYEYSLVDCEQHSPVVLMYSDPTFPDRTEAFLAGDAELLLERLDRVMTRLSEWGASRFVICCMTIHYLLPRLAPELRARVVSLLDVIFARLAQTRERHLLICSNGTRRLELFQNHERWGELGSRIILPSAEDQNRIHEELIYPIKKNPELHHSIQLLEALLEKYQADSFIAGCSEIHLLAKYLEASGANHQGRRFIDPLSIIAKEMADECSIAPVKATASISRALP